MQSVVTVPPPASEIETKPTRAGKTREVPHNDFADLKRRIKDANLLDRQLGYYSLNMVISFGLAILSVALFFLIDNFLILLFGVAPLMAFAYVRCGYISHDSGHRQIFNKVKNNEIAALATGFVLGLSRTWWVDKHNLHHANPNQMDMDPDIEIPVLAFSEEQALEKRGLWRFIVKRQAYFFPFVLFLQAFSMRYTNALYVVRKEVKYPVLEPVSMIVHNIAYFAMLLYVLPLWQAALFMLVHQALFGAYMASVFAPNHKGMLVLEKDSDMDFLRRQVLTARNVRANPVNDFWYGGLNYQIEHHLFPSMPRNKLKESQKIIRQFCDERGIAYYETGVFQSYKEIVQFLHHVSIPLRQADRRK